MKKTLPLLNHPILTHHTPATEFFSNTLAEEWLTKYSTLYIKPNFGTEGIGIIRVKTVNPEAIELSYDKQKIIAKREHLIVELEKIMDPERTYCVQQGIDLATLNGCPFDIRVVLQKTDDIWQVTLKSAKVATTEDAILTNVSRGAAEVSLGDTLVDTDQKLNALDSLVEIVDLSHQIARVLEQHFTFRLLGLDLALDKQGHVWFIEANTRPQTYGMRKLNPDYSYDRYVKAKKRLADDIEQENK